MQHPDATFPPLQRLPHPSLLLHPRRLPATREGRLIISCLDDRSSLPAGLLASSFSLLPSILHGLPDKSSLNTAHCLSLPSSEMWSQPCRLLAPHRHRLLQRGCTPPDCPVHMLPLPLLLLPSLSGQIPPHAKVPAGVPLLFWPQGSQNSRAEARRAQGPALKPQVGLRPAGGLSLLGLSGLSNVAVASATSLLCMSWRHIPALRCQKSYSAKSLW